MKATRVVCALRRRALNVAPAAPASPTSAQSPTSRPFTCSAWASAMQAADPTQLTSVGYARRSTGRCEARGCRERRSTAAVNMAPNERTAAATAECHSARLAATAAAASAPSGARTNTARARMLTEPCNRASPRGGCSATAGPVPATPRREPSPRPASRRTRTPQPRGASASTRRLRIRTAATPAARRAAAPPHSPHARAQRTAGRGQNPPTSPRSHARCAGPPLRKYPLQRAAVPASQ